LGYIKSNSEGGVLVVEHGDPFERQARHHPMMTSNHPDVIALTKLIKERGHGDGREYECLQADRVTGHPRLGIGPLGRSTRLLWIDERRGFARTLSRVYRLQPDK
jgi:hypothetical protein